jgi:hypothetical protein
MIVLISYAILNFLGWLVSIIAFCTADEFPVIPKLFSFIEYYLGKIALILASIVFIALFLPAIIINAILVSFLLLISIAE